MSETESEVFTRPSIRERVMGYTRQRPTHDFLFPERPATDRMKTNDPVAIVTHIRDHIESIPQTAHSFKLNQVAAFEKEDPRIKSVKPEMLWLCGSWKVGRSNRGTIWANPDYAHLSTLSDIDVTCECGATMPCSRDDHTDCHGEWRMNARTDLRNQRAAIIRQGFLYGNSAKTIAARALVDDSPTRMARSLGLEPGVLKDKFTERRKNTMLRLLLDYSQEAVGRAYDITPRYIREVVRHQTPFDNAALTEERNA